MIFMKKMKDEQVKINIVIGKDFLSEVDSYSERIGINRSEFIREAVGTYIAFKNQEDKLSEREQKIENAIEFFKKMGDKNKDWDGVSEINKWRRKF